MDRSSCAAGLGRMKCMLEGYLGRVLLRGFNSIEGKVSKSTEMSDE
jgi:hypothetical protein